MNLRQVSGLNMVSKVSSYCLREDGERRYDDEYSTVGKSKHGT